MAELMKADKYGDFKPSFINLKSCGVVKKTHIMKQD